MLSKEELAVPEGSTFCFWALFPVSTYTIEGEEGLRSHSTWALLSRGSSWGAFRRSRLEARTPESWVLSIRMGGHPWCCCLSSNSSHDVNVWPGLTTTETTFFFLSFLETEAQKGLDCPGLQRISNTRTGKPRKKDPL